MKRHKVQVGVFVILVGATALVWWLAREPPPPLPLLIPAVLDERASFHVTDMPFSEALQQLATRQGLKIAFDPDSPSAASIADVPVTVRVENAPLRTLCELLANQVERTIGVRNGRLFVTTPPDWRKNPNNYVARLHRLPRLLASRGDVQERELLDFVLRTLQIDGSQATKAVVQEAFPGALLISAPAEQQRQASRLLNWLADQSLPEPLHSPESTVTSYAPGDLFPLATAEVERALDKPVRLHFDATPFDEAVTQLSRELRIPIFLDMSNLRNHGVEIDAPLTGSWPEMPLREALPKLTPRDDLYLHFHVRDGVLVLTIFGRLHERPTIRLYPVARLDDRLGGNLGDELRVAIPKAAVTWPQNRHHWLGNYANVIVAHRTWDEHQTIGRFLAEFERCVIANQPQVQLRLPDQRPTWLIRKPVGFDHVNELSTFFDGEVAQFPEHVLVEGTQATQETVRKLFAVMRGEAKPDSLSESGVRLFDLARLAQVRAATYDEPAWYRAYRTDLEPPLRRLVPAFADGGLNVQTARCGHWLLVRGDAASLAFIERHVNAELEESR